MLCERKWFSVIVVLFCFLEGLGWGGAWRAPTYLSLPFWGLVRFLLLCCCVFYGGGWSRFGRLRCGGGAKGRISPNPSLFSFVFWLSLFWVLCSGETQLLFCMFTGTFGCFGLLSCFCCLPKNLPFNPYLLIFFSSAPFQESIFFFYNIPLQKKLVACLLLMQTWFVFCFGGSISVFQTPSYYITF